MTMAYGLKGELTGPLDAGWCEQGIIAMIEWSRSTPVPLAMPKNPSNRALLVASELLTLQAGLLQDIEGAVASTSCRGVSSW